MMKPVCILSGIVSWWGFIWYFYRDNCIHLEIKKLMIEYILVFTHLPDVLSISFLILINDISIYLYTWARNLRNTQLIFLNFTFHVLSLIKFLKFSSKCITNLCLLLCSLYSCPAQSLSNNLYTTIVVSSLSILFSFLFLFTLSSNIFLNTSKSHIFFLIN